MFHSFLMVIQLHSRRILAALFALTATIGSIASNQKASAIDGPTGKLRPLLMETPPKTAR
jgi:hypothetical protein